MGKLIRDGFGLTRRIGSLLATDEKIIDQLKSKMVRKPQLITLLFPLLDIIAPSTAFISPRVSGNSLSAFAIRTSFGNNFISKGDVS